MATMWFFKEGEVQSGFSRGHRSIDWCVNNLGLRQHNWFAPLTTKELTFGEKRTNGLEPYRSFCFVIVALKEEDLETAPHNGWRPGFYLLNMGATEARAVLKRYQTSLSSCFCR